MLIEKVIEKKRIEMVRTSNYYGLTHNDTVKCSQELDSYLNYYHKKLSSKSINFTDVKVHKGAFINILEGSNLINDRLELTDVLWLDSSFITLMMDEIKLMMGRDVLFEIGRKVPENSLFPSGIDSFEKALIFLNDAYRLNHQGKYFGEYMSVKEKNSVFKLFCNTPMYSDEFNYGVIIGLAEKFGRVVRVRHYCTNEGGEFTIKVLD